MRVAGIVLCGGHSRRMGRPKAWLPFGDELLLPRMVRLLGQVIQPVVVVAAQGQNLPALPADVLIVRDEIENRGPLQGLAAGLSALDYKAEAAYLSSCDAPLLRPAFVQRVIHHLRDCAICAPIIGHRPQPLAAVYRLDVLTTVKTLLAQDELRLSRLLEVVPTRLLEPEEFADIDPYLESLQNVNTPEEYESACRAFATAQTRPPLVPE